MPIDWDEPHDVKGLAQAMGRSRGYVEDMKACGFQMPGHRGTVRMAFDFLAKHPEFSRRHAAQVRFSRRELTGTNGNTGAIAKS